MSSIEHAVARAAIVAIIVAASSASSAFSQQPSGEPTRAGAIAAEEAAKSAALHPFEAGTAERVLNVVEGVMVSGSLHVHPFFQSAYAGGGFTLGAGYAHPVSAYNLVDVRGSFTFSGYKRLEAAFLAPRLFSRHASLSLLGGWREATEVGFYGIGTSNTSKDDRANYSFDQPYGSAVLDYWPMRKIVLLRGGLELSTWNQGAGHGSGTPSVEEVYAPDTLPGLGSSPTYVHTEATFAIDMRQSPGYARSGGFYAVSLHDFHDQDDRYGFRRTDYEAIQHVPILRDAWVLSLHGRVQVAEESSGQEIPFFMLPSLGGGSSLRGFASWRFRDRNSLLLQAEWRVLANRFLDMGLFYDAGRVAARAADLTDSPLKSDYGVGFRFHSQIATPLRIEFARSNEGFVLVFSSKAAF